MTALAMTIFLFSALRKRGNISFRSGSDLDVIPAGSNNLVIAEVS